MENRNFIENSAETPANSADIYYWFWLCCRLVGIDARYNKYLRVFYDIFLNVFVTIAYPLHLTIGLFLKPTLADIFKNLSISVTCIACSIKYYILRSKSREIQNMQEKLCQLDQSILDADEKQFFNNVLKVKAIRIILLFFAAAVGADISATVAALLSKERRLMYPAWLPFDFTSSAWRYWLAFGYQFFGVSMQIVQNLANDMYTPLSLCIVGGHVRLLGMRVSKIGYDSKRSEEENRQDLISCIRDHETVISVLRTLQSIVYFGTLVQFLCSGLLICVTLVYLLYYVDSFFGYIYYALFLFCMGLEIFPCCYFGSLLEQELSSLPYAIFNSNWFIATPKYRKELIMFIQLTLRDIKLTAGGIIGINLNAFFGTCKMAYSMFAVILRTR